MVTEIKSPWPLATARTTPPSDAGKLAALILTYAARRPVVPAIVAARAAARAERAEVERLATAIFAEAAAEVLSLGHPQDLAIARLATRL